MNKKFQVFVSSTYKDLIEERQVVVESILESRHIPAGMELFASSDEEQMKVIKKWIDESDIYMLLLGGKYGSIEPKTGKSYTQLEYEYALETNKPFFSIVLSDSYLHAKESNKTGTGMPEKKAKDKYEKFKQMVETKIVKHVDNIDQIRSSIMVALKEKEDNINIIGWIKANSTIEDSDSLKIISNLNNELDTLKQEKNKLIIENEANKKDEKDYIEELKKKLSNTQFFIKIDYNDNFGYPGTDNYEISGLELVEYIGLYLYTNGSIDDRYLVDFLDEYVSQDNNKYSEFECNKNDVVRIFMKLESLKILARTNNGKFYFTKSGSKLANELVLKKAN